MSLRERIRWFIEHQDSPPQKVHRRDLSEGGTPEWTKGFALWVELDKDETQVIEYNISDSQAAPTLRYRTPMKAAMASLRRQVQRADEPNMALALSYLVGAGGHIAVAAEWLVPSWPRFADHRYALSFYDRALRSCQGRYSLEVPWDKVPTIKRKSDNQLDAERNAS